MRDETAPAATAATADTPDSFGGICGLLGGIGGGTPRPPTGSIIVFLMVAVEPDIGLPAAAVAADPPPIAVVAAFRTPAALAAICCRSRGWFHGWAEELGSNVIKVDVQKTSSLVKFLLFFSIPVWFCFVSCVKKGRVDGVSVLLFA